MTGLLVAAAILGVIGLLGYVWSHRTGTVARAIGAAGAEYNELYGSGPSTADPAACRSEVGLAGTALRSNGSANVQDALVNLDAGRYGVCARAPRRRDRLFLASQAVDHAKPMRWLGKRADRRSAETRPMCLT